MAHEVETMAYFGDVPWHGLGTALAEEDLYDWQSACKKAGLDWQVEKVPLVTADDARQQVEHFAIRRTDGKILGTVGKKYTILQNADSMKFFQPFLATKEAQLHTAGSLREGSRIWVLAKLNRDPVVIAAGDEVEKFILLSHSHDGSLAVRVGFVFQRVVCANTLAMAIRSDASKLIRCKHTKDLPQNLANIREVMNLANAEFEATAEQYRLLVRKSICQADLDKYVRLVLKADDSNDASTRMNNMVEEVKGLFETGRGNNLPSIRGTLWAGYNAVTEWLSYRRGRNANNRLDSLFFGDSATLSAFALQTALSMTA